MDLAIGKHCSNSDCKQLDFLPFRCNKCELFYCQDHRFRHKCREEELTGNSPPKKKILDSDLKECFLSECNVKELFYSTCSQCSRNFCLRHRHPTDHNCESVQIKQNFQQAKSNEIKDLISEKLSSSTKIENSNKIKKPKKVNPAIELTRMKLHAMGDKGIPVESRVYFQVHLPLESNNKQIFKMFFHKDWTVGRTIDKICLLNKIENVNNKMNLEEKKISLYDTEKKLIIDTSKTWQDLISSNLITNTQQITLERDIAFASGT
ncbi:AN1-type zinc finger protein 1 [Clydaea vesicula]|uniref:AN1-type zinc finger protein 1 n=1 Tax=Clydaea vesicula TaxID=447962 RepID=A0AAD5XW30_9FUNG|nr:AN1-type zinc finger protein 1 [Clydaea vesicula]